MSVKYRGLTRNKYQLNKSKYKWVYGLPSYGDKTEEITEIETLDDFINIDPATLGKETEYKDRHGKNIYTGDITTLEVDGELREFEVVEITTERECSVLPGFEGETAKVRLSGVIAFRWHAPDGKTYDLLPCVNEAGVADPFRMEIIDTVAERAVRESEVKREKQ